MTILINGKEVLFESGDTVLEVAEKNNIYIPALCSHSRLKPYGACRLCLVEIEGMRGLVPACTTVATPGMKVVTDTPVIQELRRNILQLILSEHPSACLVCGKRELCEKYRICPIKAGESSGCQFCSNRDDCELRNVVQAVGVKDLNLPPNMKNIPLEREDPFFERDYNLCILCGRCVRVCSEVVANSAIDFIGRGNETVVGTPFKNPHAESACTFCGSCIDICPTGAITCKATKWMGKPETIVSSTCGFCSLGCEVNLGIKWGKIMISEPVQENRICVRGRFVIPELHQSKGRLTAPLLRKNGTLVPVSWEEAIDVTAQRLMAYKGDSFAVVTSPSITNEDNYVLQKWARTVMESGNIDSRASLDLSPAIDLCQAMLGTEGRSISMDEIENASTILLFAVDIDTDHPVLKTVIKKALDSGAKLMIAHPNLLPINTLGSLTLAYRPGEETTMALSLLKAILPSTYDGKINGFKEMMGTLENISLPDHDKIGIVQKMASLLKQGGNVVIIFGTGMSRAPYGIEGIKALANLTLLIPGAKLIPMSPYSNARGALLSGASPCLMPGDLEKRWIGESSSPAKGRSLREIYKGIETREIRALYLADDTFTPEILSNLEFLAVSDIFAPKAQKYATVVFPSVLFGEVDGTLTNFEGKQRRLAKAVEPPGLASPDWKIVSQIATKMGSPDFKYEKSQDVFDEMMNIYSKITSTPITNKTPEFKAFDLKGRFESMERDERFPYILACQEGTYSLRSANLIELIPGLKHINDVGKIEISYTDAKKAGIIKGENVRVISKDGEIVVPAHVSNRVCEGTACLKISMTANNLVKFPGDMMISSIRVRIEKQGGKNNA